MSGGGTDRKTEEVQVRKEEAGVQVVMGNGKVEQGHLVAKRGTGRKTDRTYKFITMDTMDSHLNIFLGSTRPTGKHGQHIQLKDTGKQI